jgi:hypothetical protein
MKFSEFLAEAKSKLMSITMRGDEFIIKGSDVVKLRLCAIELMRAGFEVFGIENMPIYNDFDTLVYIRNESKNFKVKRGKFLSSLYIGDDMDEKDLMQSVQDAQSSIQRIINKFEKR